jgi:hypothetical protein
MSEWKPTQRPVLCRTLSAYLALIQSSIARALGREKLEGGSWTTSASVTFLEGVSECVYFRLADLVGCYLPRRTSSSLIKFDGDIGIGFIGCSARRLE